ncbi:MAG: serine/threonine protein kinase [Kofleriaceae bacterium]|nr:serine/threonine protein kinase [Kofleriaceae bacterium]
MDRTNRDEDRPDVSLDETLPSQDGQSASLSRETRPTGEIAAVADLEIEKGTEIGRYVVIEPIGSGTMGLVVAAFDPTLDRKVAIKVVRLDPSGTTSGRQRLIREAQAMAKLQHPNVVTVFEVGTFRDQLFLAMEYIAGSTLADWLKQPGRTQREIVDAFVAAGRGLAAAHRAGIVHRDFKPSNVLVANDGRVRVADFGLATAPTEAPPPVHVPISRDSDPGPMGMTKTGAILGTPAYMSPEQYRGEAADARADQYSFCVALYEALYGELPFEGAAFLVYRDNVLAGRLREPPKDSAVPPRIRRVLVRGLALAPGERYPDLDPLLDELSYDPAARRRVAIVGAIGAGAVAATAVALLVGRSSKEQDPCAAAERPIASVWTADQRKALEQSFLATGSPGAPDAFARIAKAFDDRVGALRAARRDACEATSVRHEQSAELLDRRIACVDERASATTALVGVLTEQRDADSLSKALNAVLALPPLEPCADRAALLADSSQPPPAIRPQVEELVRRLDRAEAMSNAGLYGKAVDELSKIAPAADQLGHAPVQARAHFLAADAHIQLDHNTQGIAEFRKTLELAAAAHDDELVARASIGLYGAVGYRQGKYDEARGLEQATATAVLRAGNSPRMRSHLENARGLVELGREDYPAAAAHFQASAAEAQKDGHANLVQVANALSNAGIAFTWGEKYDDSKAAFEKSLAIGIEVLGPDHANVGYTYHGLGVLYDNMGEPEKALEQFRKSEAISRRAYPADSVQIAKGLVSVGLVLGELERYDEALDAQLKALAIFEKHPEDSKREMNTVLFDTGLAYLSAHRTKEALAMMQRALASAEAEYGPESDEAGSVLGGMLAVSDIAGDHDKAREYGMRALAIREKTLGPDHQQVARVLGDLAQNANERRQPQEAMKLVDRALAIITKPGTPPLTVKFNMLQIRATAELALKRTDAALADARAARDGFIESKQPTAGADASLVVADALWQKGGRRDAVAEVKKAIETIEAQPKPDAELLGKARAWLAAHAN